MSTNAVKELRYEFATDLSITDVGKVADAYFNKCQIFVDSSGEEYILWERFGKHVITSKDWFLRKYALKENLEVMVDPLELAKYLYLYKDFLLAKTIYLVRRISIYRYADNGYIRSNVLVLGPNYYVDFTKLGKVYIHKDDKTYVYDVDAGF